MKQNRGNPKGRRTHGLHKSPIWKRWASLKAGKKTNLPFAEWIKTQTELPFVNPND